MHSKKSNGSNNAASAATSSSSSSSSGGSSDAKPDNYQINAKICRLVERHPCMYDRTHTHYSKKDVVDKAWIKIAKEMDDSIPSCKERWRNIRTSFARSINVNKTPASANRTKPYYLHEELQFLARHITPGIPVSRRSNNASYYSAGEESENIEISVCGESFDGYSAVMQADEEDSQDRQSSMDENSEAIKCEMLEKSLLQQQQQHQQHQHQQHQHQQQREAEEEEEEFRRIQQLQLQQQQQQQQLQQQQLQQEQLLLQQQMESVKLPRPLEREAEPEVETPLVSMYPPKKRQRMLEAALLAEAALEKEQRDVKPAELLAEADFDASFLQGLLPEMKAMDFRQKILFKRRIYEVIGEIFDNNGKKQNGNAHAEQDGSPESLTMVNSSDLAMIRRLNSLLQSPNTTVASAASSTVTAVPKNVGSISSTVRSTPPSPSTVAAVQHRGATTRSSANLLRVSMLNPPMPITASASSSSSSCTQVKQEQPEPMDD